MWIFKSQKPTKSLGVDIGSKAIRIVEISEENDRKELTNYGELKLDDVSIDTFKYFNKQTFQPSIENVSRAIRAILEEAEIETKEAVFSLPDFSTFFTSFSLPPMKKEELDGAVHFESKKHIPLPFDDIVIDWQLIGEAVNDKEGENKILAMAISKKLIENYKQIAVNCGLRLMSLEAEVIGLKRAIVGKSEDAYCLVEIGYQSTTMSIIEKGFITNSISFDMAGKDFTYSISESLSIGLEKAEKIKKAQGIVEANEKEIEKVLSPILSVISIKLKNIISDFEEKNNKKIQKIILTGGSSQMPGILEYFKKEFIDIETGNAFDNIFYPSEIKPILPDINSTFSVALGEALKRFE
jgi:type IV pilus assembly protein PilM